MAVVAAQIRLQERSYETGLPMLAAEGNRQLAACGLSTATSRLPASARATRLSRVGSSRDEARGSRDQNFSWGGR
jgi:hypothetical protein